MLKSLFTLSLCVVSGLAGAVAIRQAAVADFPKTNSGKLYINFPGATGYPIKTGTMVVPDQDTSQAASGSRLSGYDVQIGQMIALTAYWCGEADDNGVEGVEWNYIADSGEVFMGRFSIRCNQAQNILSTYGVKQPEQIRIHYRGNPRDVSVAFLDLNEQEISKFQALVQTFRPQCLEDSQICPGDRLE
ncbi:hypothetical protein [Microcoleus sp. FACHB-68]|uniref:hypothetical protein n=1 Tax=Microcoleus sp. FACHB-68 TaxID=2692826 RepID=UPI0016865A4B|nr:hypothetical protein [Microcoleus sp. FACHB-68]MBD1935910.1 hypothetical protein [Microcoleus sp. FACHB-68]